MKKINALTIIFQLILALLIFINIGGKDTYAQTAAGTVISNQVQAVYTDETKREYKALSQIVTVKITSVHRLAVTPDDTASSADAAQRAKITRSFTITNSGNSPDSYTISSVSATSPAIITELYFDTDKSHTLTSADQKIELNSTVSPLIPQTSSIDVLVVIETNNIAVQSLLTIDLTAKSSADSSRQDSGKIINRINRRAKISSPNDPNSQPIKSIDGQIQAKVSNGQIINYDIAFSNNGEVDAENVSVVDNLPIGAKYVAGSLRVNNRSVSDAKDADQGKVVNQIVEILLEKVAPNEVIHITFQAQINSVQLNTNITNTTIISGSNFDSVESTKAVAVVDPFAIVFAGRSGGSVTVNNAQVALFNASDSSPITLPQNSGYAPNENNKNAFTTNSDGRYTFTLGTEQISSSSNYVLKVSAEGYKDRSISIKLSPNTTTENGLYKAVLEALDGQPLAQAGSFNLTKEAVTVNNLAALAFNVPLFETSSLTIQKNADRANAEIGDVVTYQVTLQNSTPAVINQIVTRDQLPNGFIFVAGSGQVQDNSGVWHQIEPETTAENLLIFKLDSLEAGKHAIFSYRVRIGANVQTGVNINTAIAKGFFLNNELTTTLTAQASVRITNGTFSTQQSIIGRVFDDKNNNGIFDKKDLPIAGARIYTNKGQFVVTDSAGMYNLPVVEDGSLVLELDPLTLPNGLTIADTSRRDNKGFERLLRTPLLGGSLLKQDFVLEISKKKAAKDSTYIIVKDSQANSNQQTAASPNAVNEADKTVNLSTSEKSNPDAAPKVGTFDEVVSETINPVAPGVVEIITPQLNQVIMSPALELEARVAANWKIVLTVNGVAVGKENIGVFKQFHASQVDSFTFVGIGLKPGINTLVATAFSPEGREGQSKEITVMGRGTVKRLEISTERRQLKADGRDETEVYIKALDEWGNPATDNQVALTISQGSIALSGETSDKTESNNVKVSLKDASDLSSNNQIAPININRQRILNLENGFGTARIIAGNAPGNAEIIVSTDKAETKQIINYVPNLRPTLVVGLAEASFGRAAPVMNLRGLNSKLHSKLGFFYSGKIFDKNLLTVSYDSERALNRTNGRDRLFEQDPLDRAYPVFGDSSTRFEGATSNSKLYARLDRGFSYAMFGDFETELSQLSLAGYSRKLTGAKLHIANSKGDLISLTGARPNTSFTRDTFPGNQLGIVRLSQPDLLQGSEVVTLEVRDRRNPEITISREQLVRSVDYNLDPINGQIFFLRPLMAFDFNLNLVQVVVTYEHFTNQNSSNVYTGRAQKQFNRLGLKLGLTVINQQQENFGSFLVGGIDGEKNTFNGGKLKFEYATSRGTFAAEGNNFASKNLSEDNRHDGNAFQIEYEQPLNYKKTVLRAKFARADADFYNPFGSSVAPGSQRTAISIEMKPRASSQLRFGFMDERNQTENVDNQRSTVSTEWTEQIRNNLRLSLGYDFRKYNDELSENDVTSNLITLGAEWKPTEKLQFNIKREQNLGEADPTYPNQTTLAAKYQVNNLTNIFFTQRLATNAIRPISDTSTLGFASTASRNETAFGVESKLWRYSTLSGRYQIENGINGTDSFAVIGLQNSLPINKKSSVEFGFERGFLLAGGGKSFNTALLGYSWKNENFRSNVRYELRDRAGLSKILTAGVAGKLGKNTTVLGRFQFADGDLNDQRNKAMQGTAAFAYRPLSNDRVALLFSYNLRSNSADNRKTFEKTIDRSDTLSTDGLWQASKRLEFYGHAAMRFGENGKAGLSNVSTLTYLAQGRAQYKLWDNWDAAVEVRYLSQPASKTFRVSTGLELGYWVLPDVRLGGGYNLSKAYQPSIYAPSEFQKTGFYFNVTTKLSRIFNLFGSKKEKDEDDAPKPNISVVDKQKK